jgi:hypothetical protein
MPMQERNLVKIAHPSRPVSETKEEKNNTTVLTQALIQQLQCAVDLRNSAERHQISSWQPVHRRLVSFFMITNCCCSRLFGLLAWASDGEVPPTLDSHHAKAKAQRCPCEGRRGWRQVQQTAYDYHRCAGQGSDGAKFRRAARLECR